MTIKTAPEEVTNPTAGVHAVDVLTGGGMAALAADGQADALTANVLTPDVLTADDATAAGGPAADAAGDGVEH